MVQTASTDAANKVMLRAIAARQPDDWRGHEETLAAVDLPGWNFICASASKHGLVGIVARGLAWGQQQAGVRVPVLEMLETRRRAQLLTLLKRKKVARQTGDALTAASIPFVVFKGAVLAEEIYGDLSLRTFGDCDVLVRPHDLDKAASVLNDLGYRIVSAPNLEFILAHHGNGASYKNEAGEAIDLHWGLAPDLTPSQNEIVWQHCQPPARADALPGLRLEPELCVAYLASHFHRHQFQEFKLLADVYAAATHYADRLDIGKLHELAASLGMLPALDLAARLCERCFIPNDIFRRIAPAAPTLRARLAHTMLTDRSLLRIEAVHPIDARIRRLFYSGTFEASVRACRSMLLPTSRDLELRFEQPFSATMYPKYYWTQLYRLASRTDRSFADLTSGQAGHRPAIPVRQNTSQPDRPTS
jgi:hypothetical protein